MYLARVRTDDGVVTGEYEERTVTTADGSYVVGEDAELLAPTEPSALYCVGRNYEGTIEQRGYERPEQPSFFIKPPASVLDPGAAIPYPAFSEEVTYAGELAAVIGREAHDLDESEVDEVVLGYTNMNDLDALDQPGLTERKAFDGSAPLDPVVATDIDPTDLAMTADVSGERRQDPSTDAMLFGPREVVSFLTARLTLRPGDVVSFGSPPNPGVVEPGDEVSIWYEGIGTLPNAISGPR